MPEPAMRPYTTEEIAKLAEQLDTVLNGRPWVVSFSCLMLQALAMLRACEDNREPVPEALQAVRAAIEPVMFELFRACEAGPYEGMRVV